MPRTPASRPGRTCPLPTSKTTGSLSTSWLTIDPSSSLGIKRKLEQSQQAQQTVQQQVQQAVQQAQQQQAQQQRRRRGADRLLRDCGDIVASMAAAAPHDFGAMIGGDARVVGVVLSAEMELLGIHPG